MTTEEKANAYDEAIKKVKDLISRCKNDTDRRTMIYRVEDIETLFPELAESKNEKIRKAIISGMTALKDQGRETFASIPINDCITWLEKQAEKKPILDFKAKDWYVSKVDGKIHNIYHSVDKVKPIFKVGDWLVHNERKHIIKVVNHTPLVYEVVNILGHHHTITNTAIENNYHLWTIQDAKEGDVLSYVTDEEDLWIMIYWSLYEPYEGHVHYHALLINDNFSCKGTCCICIDNLKPATKEQRDLFFQKMEEAGYEWDAEKKGLSCYMA